MKKDKLFELFLIIIVMAGAGYAAFSDAHNFPNRWFTRDDAYYYFKVAQNISEGFGSTFDGVNLTNGYHPLWVLICIPIFSLARFDVILPLRILVLVMGAISAATGVLLYRLISRVLLRSVAVLVAIFWGFNFYIRTTVVQFGLETGITAFSIVLLLYLFQKSERKKDTEKITLGQIAKFALVSVLIIFSRLDTVFLALLFGFYLVFRATPLRYFLLSDILGIIFLGFASFTLRVGIKDYYLHAYGETVLIMVFASLILLLPLYYFAGLYQHPRNESLPRLLLRILLVSLVGSGIISALMIGLGRFGVVGNVPRMALIVNGGALLAWVGITRLGVRYLSTFNEQKIISPLQLFQKNWKKWLSEGFTYFGIVGGALGLYMLFNKVIFGTSTPLSGQVKRWWGSLSGNVYGGSPRDIHTFFGLDLSSDSDFNAWGLATEFISNMRDSLTGWFGYSSKDAAYWQLFIFIIIVIFIILLISRKRTIRASVHFGLLPLFVGSVVQVISYNAMGYSAAKEWYWVSQIIFTLLLTAIILDIFIRAVMRIHPLAYRLIWAGIALFAIIGVRTYFAQIAHLMPYGVEHEGHQYMEIVAVVEENTEPGSIIGMTGGGSVGYFISDRTIVNMDGLINSYDYFQAHQERRGDDYLAEMGLDYVFVNPLMLTDIPYKGEFEDRLGEPIANYHTKVVIKFYLTKPFTP